MPFGSLCRLPGCLLFRENIQLDCFGPKGDVSHFVEPEQLCIACLTVVRSRVVVEFGVPKSRLGCF